MMNRRDMMQLGAGFLASSAPAVGAGPEPAGGTPGSGPYFLSKVNPVATTDQIAGEDQAIRLLARTDVQAARRQVGFLFRLAYGTDAPPELEPTFEAAMDEYAFNYLLKAAASDAEHPRVVRDFMAPHHWFGRDVPGARMGGDNPDNCYRLVGVDEAGRYRVTVTPAGPEPAHASFTLVANYGTSKTVQTFEAAESVRQADGSFEILIDAEPADGRPNHLRSAPGTKFLFVRDSFSDWSSETPYALRVERLNPSGAPPIDDDEAAQRAIAAMIDEVPLYYWFTRLNTGKPLNTLASPALSGALGGLVTQAGTQGWFRLDDDHAAIVRLDPAGARYCALELVEWWYRSIDAETTFSSLTDKQAVLDPDGRMTLVIAHRDPGARNWLETGGRRELLVLARWQGLPPTPVRAGPQVLEARLIPLSALRETLGPQSVFVTPEERATLRRERQAAYRRRYQV